MKTNFSKVLSGTTVTVTASNAAMILNKRNDNGTITVESISTNDNGITKLNSISTKQFFETTTDFASKRRKIFKEPRSTQENELPSSSSIVNSTQTKFSIAKTNKDTTFTTDGPAKTLGKKKCFSFCIFPLNNLVLVCYLIFT